MITRTSGRRRWSSASTSSPLASGMREIEQHRVDLVRRVRGSTRSPARPPTRRQHAVSGALEERLRDLDARVLVVDDEDRAAAALRRAARSARRRRRRTRRRRSGSSTRTQVPTPTSLRTCTTPRCARTMPEHAGEPEPATGELGREERLEDARLRRRSMPGAVVGDLEEHVAAGRQVLAARRSARLARRPSSHGPVRTRRGPAPSAQRLARVRDQVQHAPAGAAWRRLRPARAAPSSSSRRQRSETDGAQQIRHLARRDARGRAASARRDDLPE